MRISDWSSDVCSSDLDVEEHEIEHRVDALGSALNGLGHLAGAPCEVEAQRQAMKLAEHIFRQRARGILPDAFEDDVAQVVESCLCQTQIGRAWCRERVCQYV